MTETAAVPPPPVLAVLSGQSRRVTPARVPRPERHLQVVRYPVTRTPSDTPSDTPSGASDAGGAAGNWARQVGELAGRTLGTDFTPGAIRLAVTAQRLLPDALSRGRPDVWAAAIVFLVAEHTRLFEFDRSVSRSSFARELGPTLQTLRRRAGILRPVLAAYLPLVPDPDSDPDP